MTNYNWQIIKLVNQHKNSCIQIAAPWNLLTITEINAMLCFHNWVEWCFQSYWIFQTKNLINFAQLVISCLDSCISPKQYCRIMEIKMNRKYSKRHITYGFTDVNVEFMNFHYYFADFLSGKLNPVWYEKRFVQTCKFKID